MPGTHPTRCATCDGAGEVRQVRRSLLGQIVTAGPCPTCGGIGTTIEHPCATCRGEGRVAREPVDRRRRARRHRRRSAPAARRPRSCRAARRSSRRPVRGGEGRRTRRSNGAATTCGTGCRCRSCRPRSARPCNSRRSTARARSTCSRARSPARASASTGSACRRCAPAGAATSWSRSTCRCRRTSIRSRPKLARAAGPAPRRAGHGAARGALLAHPVGLPVVDAAGAMPGAQVARSQDAAAHTFVESLDDTIDVRPRRSSPATRTPAGRRRAHDRAPTAPAPGAGTKSRRSPSQLHLGRWRASSRAGDRPRVALAVALTKAGALDTVVARCTELGVARIMPIRDRCWRRAVGTGPGRGEAVCALGSPPRSGASAGGRFGGLAGRRLARYRRAGLPGGRRPRRRRRSLLPAPVVPHGRWSSDRRAGSIRASSRRSPGEAASASVRTF